MQTSGLPATEADCEAIAEAFGRRRTEILHSIQARERSKINRTRREIIKAEATLNDLRDRLRVDYDGAAKQDVDAQVVDSGLQEAIGDTIRLRFPDNAWMPGRFTGDDVQVLIRGTYLSVKREQIEAPLLAKFRQGQGTVIFTSFHNEAQNSQQELQLLRYLVFSAVTAKEEAQTQKTMLSGGFSPVKQGQVNHALGMDSITKKYLSTSGDPLRFSLNFGGGGAILRLTLVAPGGQKFEKETDETLLVEATGAPAGEWLYTVTSVKVPYKNFAYSVGIGRGPAPRRASADQFHLARVEPPRFEAARRPKSAGRFAEPTIMVLSSLSLIFNREVGIQASAGPVRRKAVLQPVKSRLIPLTVNRSPEFGRQKVARRRRDGRDRLSLSMRHDSEGLRRRPRRSRNRVSFLRFDGRCSGRQHRRRRAGSARHGLRRQDDG